MQVALFRYFRQGVAGMSRDLGRDVQDLEKLYASELWADFRCLWRRRKTCQKWSRSLMSQAFRTSIFGIRGPLPSSTPKVDFLGILLGDGLGALFSIFKVFWLGFQTQFCVNSLEFPLFFFFLDPTLPPQAPRKSDFAKLVRQGFGKKKAYTALLQWGTFRCRKKWGHRGRFRW